jgi:hypothetical protein
MTTTYDRVTIESLEQLHDWLAAHHGSSPGAWLVLWRKGRGPYVPWGDLVRELLC